MPGDSIKELVPGAINMVLYICPVIHTTDGENHLMCYLLI